MAIVSSAFLELEKELENFSDKVMFNKEKALDETSDYVMEQLKKNTPVDTGKTKDSWERSTKYKGVRYINNIAVTGARPNSNSLGIPIVNLLEFSKKGKPFARKTFDACIPQVENIFKNNIEKGE